ncbi:MAG: molecular chaperone DjiA [Alphaproteobacteria bacterium]|nr:TerB family tellurite resistance protein [Alphaproteobacteria bacterium]TAD90298.1 MAG: molecular chaperone DjiA [Alphaproteobacteria bacterium]
MNLWGKLIGGAAGLMLGGPLGALLGAAAGHAVDAYVLPQEPDARPPEERMRSVAFTIAVIALGAKLAKADGAVTHDELAAFKEVFQVDPDEEANLQRVFDLARRSTAGFDSYARQIAAMFDDHPLVLEELLGGLFHIAKADGLVPQAELDYLKQVAAIFGFDDAAFARIRASHLGAMVAAADPWTVLDLPPDTDEATARGRYRHLVRENHPDHLIAEGLPEEAIALANQKMAAINAAWMSVRAERGWR